MNVLLQEKIAGLQRAGVAEPLIAQLQQYIEQTPAPGLIGIPPYRLADDWGFSRHEVLEAFLYATRLGLFDLWWDVHCPSCKGLSEHTQHLDGLLPEAACPYCQINFEAGFDSMVEVNFTLNPDIQTLPEVDFGEYAGYWKLNEQKLKFSVAPGATAEQPLFLQFGAHYIQARGMDCGHSLTLMVRDTCADTVTVLEAVFDGEKLLSALGPICDVGEKILRVTNQSEKPIDILVWGSKNYPWTSAAEVASTQSFRDMFSAELIAPDETFSIRNLVFVFTDIRGSTALYERLGDSNAYYLVKEHFKILTDEVKKHHGAVVKTIGDAVMATFMVSGDAARALFAMQEVFDRFNHQDSTRDEIIIKVGAHRGPCIAVNSNDRLDYFGRTVNVAARVQGLSTGRDIVLTQSFYAEPEVKAVVDASGWHQEALQVYLKGIDEAYGVLHLAPEEG